MVLDESQVVVFDCFVVVTSLVLAGASRVGCIDVVRIQGHHCCEVSDALLKHVKLLKRSTPDVESTCILRIYVEEDVAVLNGLCVIALLELTGCSNEQCLLVFGVVVQLLAAH